MSHYDGRAIHKSVEQRYDFVVVGSGPAGVTVARSLAVGGASVAVVEEGAWFRPQDMAQDAFGAMVRYYRDMGTTVMVGRSMIPYVQGKAVGGTSVINGAICWRLPENIYREWCADDPVFEAALPWAEIEKITDDIEKELHIEATSAEIAGRKNLLMAKGADALGLEHRPIRRNVSDCLGLGRCLQGCPKGRKNSVDRNVLIDAQKHGTVVFSSVGVRKILMHRGKAVGVVGKASGGGKVYIKARNGVVLAASAVQTPVLLLRNGIRHGPVGHNFQCHPGISMNARFVEPVRMWEGATQGHEVIGLRKEGLKFEVLGYGLAHIAARIHQLPLTSTLADLAHWLQWGVAIRAEAKGRIYSAFGQTIIRYTPTQQDVNRFRKGLQVLGELFLASGAEFVDPGLHGWDSKIRDPKILKELAQKGPREPQAFASAVTHMFGSCRMGSDPQNNVVRMDFRHHKIKGLYIADSSVFPSNIGVNPQIPIMALAAICGHRILSM